MVARTPEAQAFAARLQGKACAETGGAKVKERPILFSVTTGNPSQRGKRLRSADGLTWKQRNKDAVNARRRDLYAANPEKHRQRQNEYKRGNAKPKVLAANRKWLAEYRAVLRSEMIEAYGGKCSCCGESQKQFLQLDHIKNDGYMDRKIHRTSTKLFAHLKKKGWPTDRYQLLCANCNFGKMLNGGVCPHKEHSHA